MEYLLHPPQPFWGRVTSTIQCGARKGPAEVRKVFQSPRLAGEKIFMPLGQLFFWLALRTSMHCSHLTKYPARYFPDKSTLEHLQDLGLPDFGFNPILTG